YFHSVFWIQEQETLQKITGIDLRRVMGCSPSQTSPSILVEQCSTPRSRPKLSAKGQLFKEYGEDIFQSEQSLQKSLRSTKSELSSKSSNSSWDSGVYELEDEYSHIITENSDPVKVRQVDYQFVPKEHLELIVEGKACPSRLSAKDRDMKEQQAILQVLRDEGLIVRPPSKAVGGIRFELVSTQHPLTNQSSSIRKLPPLSMRRKHKQQKSELTHEEIQQKLIEAEGRRKRRTEERLNKLATKDRQEIQTIAQQQAEINRQKLEKKIQTTRESREKYLKELQEKLKSREEYAKKAPGGAGHKILSVIISNPEETHAPRVTRWNLKKANWEKYASLTNTLLDSYKEENDLARDRDDSSGLLEDCISLRKKQTILKKEILNAKCAYFKNFLENFDYRKDGPKAFRFISALNGKQTQPCKQPMKFGGKILTSDQDIAKKDLLEILP
ncbi:uncharacterized protein TNIN_7971, partial [Trichonephila inaurata madagascariensis]